MSFTRLATLAFTLLIILPAPALADDHDLKRAVLVTDAAAPG